MHSFVRLAVLTAGLVSAFPAPVAIRTSEAPSRDASEVSVGAPRTLTRLVGQHLWRAGSRVMLRGPLVVPAEARLDIEAGVTVEAAPGASIVVERNGRLNVTGTQTEPVVLTCLNNAATPGCWDGLVVLGHAPINHGALSSPAGGRGGAGGCRESTLNAAAYGGCTADDSSGVMQFLRVQYATHGLRLFGVGSKTVVRDVQVHRSTGHGLEVVGGSVPLRYLALTTNAQYGLVYSGGWTGQAQYVVIQQDATGYAGGLLGRNAQGAGGSQSATPRSAPTLANLTIVAPPSAAVNPYASASPAALRFDRGAAGQLYNVLLIEPAIAVDVDDAATCSQATGGGLRLQGAGLTAPASVADPDADPAECAPAAEAGLLAGGTTVTGTAAVIQMQSALDVVLPDLRARPGTVIALATGVAPPATGILEAVTYLGAVAPSASTGMIPWYSGWTVGEQLAAPLLVTLNGVVTALGRGGIAGVQVQVSPSGLTATTNALGQFAIAAVPTGPVEIVFTGGTPADCTTPEVVRATAAPGAVPPLDITLGCSLPAPVFLQRSIAAGEQHTCGLTTNGAAYCWGENSNGELGDGTTTRRLTPVPVSGGLTFESLAIGRVHSCGLTSTGRAFCWGVNVWGQLGDGTRTGSLIPVEVGGDVRFGSLSAGWDHTCGLSLSGTAYCWGVKVGADVGDIDQFLFAPAAVGEGLVFSRLDTGARFTCGLSSTGTAYCWGENAGGQLGDGTTIRRSSIAPVAGGLRFSTLAQGNDHTCGLTAGGTAYCWGSNQYGQLGSGTSWPELNISLTPLPVSGLHNFRSLVAAEAHGCGITTSGATLCWGWNRQGQLGNGTTGVEYSPIAVTGGYVFASVTAGALHTCAITLVGAAYCWGGAAIGDGAETQRLIPTAVSGALSFSTNAR